MKKQGIVWGMWGAYMLLGMVWLLLHEKGDAILSLNAYHDEFSVSVFHFFTKLGEWYGASFVALYLLFNKPAKSVLGYMLLILLTLLFVWFFKQVVFPDSLRPVVFFRQMGITLPIEPQYYLNTKYSFPSGHTTGVFAYFCYAAFWANSKGSKIGFMLIAFLGGLSRVFLVQHFVQDIMAGSLLGILVAFLCYQIFRKSKKMETPKMNSRIFHRS